jgi:uncharacterized protein (TIGR02680 family)
MTADPLGLPQPARSRWQPLRLGLVELFRYDSEEFWFRDGHLLLRGNNGTGKSKVLSLTLPLLLDANLRSSRVEPDGDPGKKMAWNLVLGDTYERRTGYSWIEFGRLGDDGQPQFLTLGLGLHAVAARSHQVESWTFLAEGHGADALRVGRGLWLLSAQRQVLTRERLREALAACGQPGGPVGQGQVFDVAQAYRRAVDERLFQLGPRRYDALLDTLIQLRQPQLSRRPDERALSAALTESLPPLPQELLADVAYALTQLEELRQELERTQRLHKAVQTFDQRWRIYAGMASRRQARGLRQAQTEFDKASHARSETQAQLQAALAQEAATQQRRDSAATMLAGARTRHETLLADPLNGDANRLQRAGEDARQRDRELLAAQRDSQAAGQQAEREADLLQAAEHRDAQARQAWLAARHRAAPLAAASGLHATWAAHPYAADDAAALAAAAPAAHEQARQQLLVLPVQRRDDLLLVRRRLQTHAEALSRLQPLQQALAERKADTEDAAAALALSEDRLQQQAEAHLQAWAAHLDGLRELQLDATAVLEALEQWVPRAEGEHPARPALLAAQATALQRLADERAGLARRRSELDAERQLLAEEGHALNAGVDSSPPAAAWRGPVTRSGVAGAPLWQLVDFAPRLAAAEQAGLEAALYGAGLLDAWITPDGQVLQGADGHPWRDAAWLARAQRPQSALSRWLRPDVTALSGVRASAVADLLASVACGASDPPEAEAWVAADGRFRLAGLAGAATMAEARYIGHAARQAARERRLAEIAGRLDAIAAELGLLQARSQVLDSRATRLAAEWQQAPGDAALRRAHEAVNAAARTLNQARQREAETHARWTQAEQAAQAAREALERDAADLRLPALAADLDAVERELHRCSDAFHQLAAAVRELRSAAPDLARQRERAAQAQGQLRQRQAQVAERALLAEQARAHAAALESALGPQIESLQRQLERARGVVDRLVASEKRLGDALRQATELRAATQQRSSTAQEHLDGCAATRSAEVERLRQFAATGLLASGLAGRVPDLELPDAALPWTIDPALTLARRVEQLLATLDDGDERWKRTQQQVTEDLQDLQRALSALGEQATATPNDFGFVVHVQWQQRAERPETLAALLQADLTARLELLSAREREVLENHLQAEIASQIQGLMRAASQQVGAINTELQRRPTSTGVRFRLLWQALPEGQGAPAGLHAARERLLQTHAELWTGADRRAFGALLQQRIVDERQRADSVAGDSGGLIEQLARALDYRQWHQFRVERWQDGQWRKLSGPASSGERALGLTVPLFAAVATFYGASPQAPRLMLLDEAFAGIDDAARAHCMALVREFDLDFVITSEREWGCYAELPGVAICQLQRREGIDAVHVSRWTWDGRARRPDAAPLRAVAPQALADDELDGA